METYFQIRIGSCYVCKRGLAFTCPYRKYTHVFIITRLHPQVYGMVNRMDYMIVEASVDQFLLAMCSAAYENCLHWNGSYLIDNLHIPNSDVFCIYTMYETMRKAYGNSAPISVAGREKHTESICQLGKCVVFRQHMRYIQWTRWPGRQAGRRKT